MYEKIYYVKEKPQKPPKNFKFLKYIILILIFVFTVNIFANIFIYSSTTRGSFLVSPLARDIIQKTVSFINSQANSANLSNIVLPIIGNNSQNYGIVIKNLQTGERYYLNEDKQFGTASLYKLWVMTVAFKAINNGEIKDTDILTDSVSNINERLDISSDSAELTDGTVAHTVSDAIAQMITVSDNYSAYLLTDKIGFDKVSEFLSKNGFNHSHIGTQTSGPVSSASDVSMFFEKLITGNLADNKTSEKMLDLLKNQQKNSKLPSLLPHSVVFAHKTGELGTLSHDGGIVYTKKGNYIIIVMSQTNDTPSADKNMALISKQVYNYFTK